MENISTSPVEVTENVSVAPTVEEVKASIVEEMNALIAWVLSCQSLTFFAGSGYMLTDEVFFTKMAWPMNSG